MANLNLSQFTEKTFVADADWTFVWDTAGAISKKVSRNNWLNSGELTTSAPVTISQTWNAVAQTFKALVVNAAGTSDANSAVGSLLLDLQVNGTSKVNFRKNGLVYTSGGVTTPDGFYISSSADGSNQTAYFTSGGFALPSGATLGFTPVSSGFGLADTVLRRDAANTLALRNGINPQTFNVYGTYTSGTSYERLTLSAPSSANAIIGTNKGSGGGTARGLEIQTDGVSRWTISTAGHFLASTHNQYDIGASGANMPRNVYVGGYIVAGGGLGNGYYVGAFGGFSSGSTGVFRWTDNNGSDFGRFQLGGTNDNYPAIARDGAGIKFTGAATGSTSWVKVPPVAVSALPLAATAGVGARAFVNDATSPVFGSAVTGGGAVSVPVYSDGSAWNVG